MFIASCLLQYKFPPVVKKKLSATKSTIFTVSYFLEGFIPGVSAEIVYCLVLLFFVFPTCDHLDYL